jgi:hypothetical protein
MTSPVDSVAGFAVPQDLLEETPTEQVLGDQ